MFIKRLEAKNFKSFSHLNIEFGNLNVVVGANASGKSNLIGIFKFLHSIAQYGLAEAINTEGGFRYLLNSSLGTSEPLTIAITYLPRPIYKNDNNVWGHIYEAKYEFSLQLSAKGELVIGKDKLTLMYTFQQGTPFSAEKGTHLGNGVATYESVAQKIETSISLPINVKLEKNVFFPAMITLENVVLKNELVLGLPIFDLAHGFVQGGELFRDIAVYDFEFNLPKRLVSAKGRSELLENASNLPATLKRIFVNADDKRMFRNLLAYLLPFVEDISLEETGEHLFFTIQEQYQADYLPAFLLSEGTIASTALIVALYFENKHPLILEEPDNRFHPRMIAKILDLMREVSEKRQIIFTTHNPEVMKYIDLEEIIAVKRDKHGFSHANHPVELETVRIFLENNLTVDDLFKEDMLGV